MKSRWSLAPVRRFVLAGASVFAISACGSGDVDDGPRVLELTNDTIQLSPGERLIDISVRRDSLGDFDPSSIEAKTGDYIRFTAHDRGGHALAFEGAALAEPARAYLHESGQLRSPPLITDNSAWVISLEGAPPGEYPFRCTTHDISGRITVRNPAP